MIENPNTLPRCKIPYSHCAVSGSGEQEPIAEFECSNVVSVAFENVRGSLLASIP